MSAWRYRQYPACYTVMAAGALRQLTYGSRWNQRGSSKCTCPQCGYRAPRAAFRVVRDARRDGAA
jgi:hypothetical protein